MCTRGRWTVSEVFPGDWVSLPLSHSQVVVARASAASWRSGFALTSPCRRELLAAHEMLGRSRVARIAAAMPQRTTSTAHAAIDTAATVAELAGLMSAGVVAAAVALPRQVDRPHGVALVDTRNGHRTFLKWSDDHASIEAEIRSLTALDGGTARFRTPTLRSQGRTDALTWMATDALPGGRHRPCWRPDWDAFEQLLAKVDQGDDHDTTESFAHGDCAPWNVRESEGQVWVVDWADSGTRPVGFDRLYFETAARAMRRHVSMAQPSTATLVAVRELVDSRVADRAEPLDLAMSAVLDAFEG